MAQVCLIQSDASLRKLLRLTFRSSYPVVEAETIEAAFATLRESARPLVAILSDWPNVWCEALLRASESEPTLRRHEYLVVSVNGDVREPELRLLLRRLSIPIVRAPYDLDELQELVRDASARADARWQGASGVAGTQ